MDDKQNSCKRFTRVSIILSEVIIVSIIVILAIFMLYRIQPIITSISYIFTDSYGNERSTSLEVFEKIKTGKRGKIHISAQLYAWRVFPIVYTVAPYDCLEHLEINGVTINAKVCAPYTKTIVLNKYLSTGENNITAVIDHNEGQGGMFIAPSMRDPVQLLLMSTIVLLPIGYIFLRTRK